MNKASNISRYDYIKNIIKLFGINCGVKIASNDKFLRSAPVSHNESAVNYKLDLLGLNVMGKWKESLRKYISRLKVELND